MANPRNALPNRSHRRQPRTEPVADARKGRFGHWEPEIHEAVRLTGVAHKFDFDALIPQPVRVGPALVPQDITSAEHDESGGQSLQ